MAIYRKYSMFSEIILDFSLPRWKHFLPTLERNKIQFINTQGLKYLKHYFYSHLDYNYRLFPT